MSLDGINFNFGAGQINGSNPVTNFQKISEVKSAPIQMTSSNTVQREELGFVNPYNSADTAIAQAREIASTTNQIMADLGYQNFKVSPKTVVSVTEGVNQYTLPAMNQASDNAVAARVADPKGPFAELFT